MAHVTERVMKEVVQVTIHCDLCGSSADVPRYAENRVCRRCGRDVCAKCQNSDEEEFSVGPECAICCRLAGKYRPKINAAYEQIDALQAAWKVESLATEANEVAG